MKKKRKMKKKVMKKKVMKKKGKTIFFSFDKLIIALVVEEDMEYSYTFVVF